MFCIYFCDLNKVCFLKKSARIYNVCVCGFFHRQKLIQPAYINDYIWQNEESFYVEYILLT